MKIAIQGHPTRGKEVIQILESLGTKAILDHDGSNINWYYMRDDSLCPEKLIITSADETFLKQYGYSVYTLEEFEKEFPFKIGDEVIFSVKVGWLSGKVTGLTYVEDQLKYEVYTRIGGYRYVEPHKLQLYPMKEERNIKLTLDKAKEWYKKGGELKEVALQAYSEKELNPLPRSWEEFCAKSVVKPGEAWLSKASYINVSDGEGIRTVRQRGLCPSKESAEAHLAMMQLEQLRDCYRRGWKPNWLNGNEEKYAVKGWRDKSTIERTYVTHEFLSFKTYETAYKFQQNFKDLIEKAGDLI